MTCGHVLTLLMQTIHQVSVFEVLKGVQGQLIHELMLALCDKAIQREPEPPHRRNHMVSVMEFWFHVVGIEPGEESVVCNDQVMQTVDELHAPARAQRQDPEDSVQHQEALDLFRKLRSNIVYS